MTATVRTTWRATGAGSAAQAVVDALVPAFAAEAPDPSKVEMIFTDRYEQVVEEFAAQEVHQNRSDPTVRYSAARPDGALAVAKTFELPAGRIVVVASVGLLAQENQARRAILHEAQHVRLIQHGDSAFAAHRRIAFEPLADLPWEFLWIGESALDEFRCERAVYERGLAAVDPFTGSVPRDYPAIELAFQQAKRVFQRTGDVMSAYQAAFAALDRLAMYLAYGAAALSVSAPGLSWDSVPGMVPVLQVLRALPGTNEQVDNDRLVAAAVELGRVLRGLLQKAGYDYFYTPDGGAYFKLLDSQ
jgi:hypothetical protein